MCGWSRSKAKLAWAAAHVGGNHEVSNGGENWLGYKLRYPNNHADSGSDSFLWYSFEAGPVHFIMLCSYADFTDASIQAQWLRSDLARVDRKKTPWLIAVWHTPWYTSNHHHPMSEGAAMRESMETLMMQAEVDLIINGHVHAYERTKPVYQLALDEARGIPCTQLLLVLFAAWLDWLGRCRADGPSAICSPPDITIGDGGNREGFATPWNFPQPDWTALRQDAYGYGLLDISPSTAEWKWNRIADKWNPNPAGLVRPPAFRSVGSQAHHQLPVRCGWQGDSATYKAKK